MRTILFSATWLFLIAALDAQAYAAGVDLPLTVTDHGKVKRESWPVSGGVPLPKGYLKKADLKSLELVDSGSKPVPSFQEPVVLGSWKDGSVRWALLDFAADVPAGGESRYRLRQRTGSAQTAKVPRVKVMESPDSFTVDTGVLKAVLNKKKFAFIEQAWVDANGDGSYAPEELVAKGPGEMFVDLDNSPPGAADSGVKDFKPGDKQFFGMEGGNWMRKSGAAESTRYLASAGEYKIELFRQGEMHTVFRLEGFHRNAAGRQFVKYTLYLDFYAGKSFVRAFHTWIMTGGPDKNFIRRMGIEVPLSPQPTNYAFGGEFENSPPAPGGWPLDSKGPSKVVSGTMKVSDEAYILSVGPDKYYHHVPRDKDLRVEYEVNVAGRKAASGYGASGWGDFSDGKLGLAAGVRDFYREHPKEIGVAGNKVTLYVWPDHGGRTLDLRRRYPECRGPSADAGNAARREFAPPGSAVGVAKTTELFFYFHAGDHARAKVDDTFHAFEEPLMPFAGGEWNCKTGVWGPLCHHDPKSRPEMENYIALSYHWPYVSQKEFSWYGMLDWGDALLEYECIQWELENWPGMKGVYANWGYAGWSSEWDPGQFMLVQYLRGGDWRHFRLGEARVRHQRDVDGVHWEKPDDGPVPGDNEGGARLGGGHRHDQQHWGGHLSGYAIPNISVGHLYYLTGEGRCLDAYRNIAQYHAYAPSIENEGRLTLAYIGEVLGEQKWIDIAIDKMCNAGDCRPMNCEFGRPLVANMMAVMLADICTEDPRVRKRAIEWGALPPSDKQGGEGMLVMWAYLKSVEKKDTWDAKIKAACAKITPQDLSGITPQALPQGVWTLAGPDAMLHLCKTQSRTAQFVAYKPWGNFPIGMLPWALRCLNE
jgi:hypothetical protein